MPLKKSAMLLIALAVSSVTALVYSSNKIMPASGKINCCKKLIQKDLFVPWNIISRSVLADKA